MDNGVCVYGERKKATEKIYPKGYVLYQLRAERHTDALLVIQISWWPTKHAS